MSETSKAEHKHTSIYLCAPVNALVEGIYEENIPLAEIKRHGDFGLGTFDQLDGEMIMLDGRVFQITGDGRVSEVGDEAETPFACVTFYRTHSTDRIARDMAYPEFLAWLESLLPSPNTFYAIRIEGLFAHVRVRSVPKQEAYRPLVEVAREQPEFSFSDIEGTLAGFYTPEFMSALSVPGLHLHFLSADLQHGGHLLECEPRKLEVGLQFINHLELALPVTLDYLTLEFHRDVEDDLDEAEK